jgi:hypothetical protein
LYSILPDKGKKIIHEFKEVTAPIIPSPISHSRSPYHHFRTYRDRSLSPDQVSRFWFAAAGFPGIKQLPHAYRTGEAWLMDVVRQVRGTPENYLENNRIDFM